MPRNAQFIWHPDARAFVADRQVEPVLGKAETGLVSIPPFPAAKAIETLGTALAQGRAFCLHGISLPADTTAPDGTFLTLTGGSSGAPKVVRRSQASWVTSFEVNARLFAFQPQDTVAVFGALSHSLALYGLLEALHLGMDAHVLAGLAPGRQRAAIAARRVTVLYVTPTQLRLLSSGGDSLPSVRLILCGGGALDAAAQARVQTLCPNARILVFYGAAETSFVSISDSDTPPGSVGRAYPGVSIAMRDARGQATEVDGEIWVKSPYLFDGYVSDAEGAAWAEDWLSVGELGKIDSDGYLWITGRKSRVVNVADSLVSPEAIESHLSELPGIPSAVVLPKPDRMRGTRLILVLEGAARHYPRRSGAQRLPGGVWRNDCAKDGPLPPRFSLACLWQAGPCGVDQMGRGSGMSAFVIAACRSAVVPRNGGLCRAGAACAGGTRPAPCPARGRGAGGGR